MSDAAERTPRPVSLQISLAPSDLPHAREIVPHQLRQLGGQVEDVTVTVDTQPGTGRFSAGWAEGNAGLDVFLEHLTATHANVRVVPVDYSSPAARRVADTFFDGQPVPAKDYRGGPFYCYFYGLMAAQHDLVLHLDCDMLIGGGSQHWVSEALRILDERPNVLACNPLAGPPALDGTLNPHQNHTQGAQPDPELPHAYRFGRLSTRLYLLDRRELAELGGSRFAAHISGSTTSGETRAPTGERAAAGSYPPIPEQMISLEMQRGGLVRVDFLGSDPGMWAVHPWARDKEFYVLRPRIIERIERGALSDDQRGSQELSLGMLQRRRGFRFYRHVPGARHLPWPR